MAIYFTLNFHYYEQCFQKLFYVIIVEPVYRIFLCITWPAEMCRSGLWSTEYFGSTKGLRIFRRWKFAGATSSEP